MMHCNHSEGGFMRKPDDELKIDILELFGGELPSPSESLEEVISETTSTASSVEETPKETEGQFQEWMVARNKELELKSQELERRLQELQNQQSAPMDATVDTLSIESLQEVVGEPEAHKVDPSPEISSGPVLEVLSESVPVLSSNNSPIDFSAPIAPPFMTAKPNVANEPVPNMEFVAEPVPATPIVLDVPTAEEIKKLQADHEFFMLYDEFRNIIVYELKDLVGEKKTFTMLERTFELARAKYPEILRNANWDENGNLLENGSLDAQRLIDNKKTIDPTKVDAVVDVALSALLNLRLQAVEKGLGSGLRNKVRAHLYQWLNEKIQKSVSEQKDVTDMKKLNSYLI